MFDIELPVQSSILWTMNSDLRYNTDKTGRAKAAVWLHRSMIAFPWQWQLTIDGKQVGRGSHLTESLAREDLKLSIVANGVDNLAPLLAS